MTASLPEKIARGAMWMLLFKLFDRGLGVVSTIILARVLLPADFGLIAMAMSVIALIELASAFGFEVGLIQRRDPSRVHYDTAWTLRLLFGAFCALATAVLALPTADLYADERLAPIMWVLAIGWLVESTENIATVEFRRELNFKREFVFLSSKRIVAVVVTLAAALAFRSYWALIAGVLVGRVTGVILSYAMLPFRPRLSLAASRDMMGFSGWLFAYNLLAFLNTRASHFVIGRTQGAGPLGIFTMAGDIAALASSEITMPINRAVFPGLSRMGETADGLRSGLLQVVAAIALISLPASFGLAAIAEPLVLTLLGEAWIAAVPALQLLSIAGAMQSITASNQSAYLASGRSFVPAIVNLVFVVALLPLLWAWHSEGVTGVAMAQALATMLAVCVSVGLMRRYLGVSALALLGAIWRPLTAAIVMAGLVHALDTAHYGLSTRPPEIVRLILSLAAGVLSYVSALLLLWMSAGRPDGVERLLLNRLRRQ
jgi:O-antigen/teichoic acid export membrane protein